ncbi:MFS transporter [Actinomycetospora chiangmaiensis]|uniref:MFS transporter n=1 Tax=Actinomycetospora chiangmaiensis TaxID=402650 RepID=UPI00036CD0DC|nr:MFS transporter [Actinomycetospora chiangmaiensis]
MAVHTAVRTAVPPAVPWSMVGAGAALIGTSYGLARFAYGLFAPDLQRTFAFGPTLSGVIGAGSYVGYCVAIVVALVLTDRVGPRRMAVAAGVVATVGTATVALAPTTSVLAAGVLVAGSSTGLASPPLAAAVTRRVTSSARDRAQTVVNAGTGIGVLVSGPVALLLVGQWRLAWGLFAVIAALVTVWVARTVPVEGTPPDEGSRGVRRGTVRLVVAALGLGVASIAVWTFGRDLLTTVGGWSAAGSTTLWIVLGAAGFLGALGGDLADRLGPARSWTVVVGVLAGSTLLLALAPGTPVAVVVGAAGFGASYVCVTGFLLLWATRLYPDRSSFGVGLAFLVIALGQAVGAPVVGSLTGTFGAVTAFVACAVIGLAVAAVRPPR